jgi:hypothetical protein
MENNFTDEQMAAVLTWLEAMRDAGYTLDDIIADLTHTGGLSTVEGVS